MSKKPKFDIGADLAVRNPQRFDPDATCIIGTCTHQELRDGEHWYCFKNNGVPATGKPVWHREADLCLRIGTPLSQLSGRPGTRGFERFVEIGESWGYD